jgi:RHS repeat-associated protein
MKKLILAVCVTATISTFGQEISTPKDTTKGLSSVTTLSVVPPAPNTNTYKPNLILPSPHAASLGNYGNTSVNLSSGLPSPNIPLFELKEGETNLSMSASYQYRGFKPFEGPSIMGRGWSLNAGGLITRVIKSRADEAIPQISSSDAYGYATPENRANLADLVNNDGTLVPSGGQSLFYSIADGEPDIFIFNFMDMTGKFFFGEDGTIHVVSDRKIKIEYRVVELTQGIGNNPDMDKYHFIEFKITDENGTVYKFGDSSTNVTLPIKNVEFSTSGSNYDCLGAKMNITSWFLAEISDKNGNKINFNYTNDYTYQTGNNFYFDFTNRGRSISSPVTRGQLITSSQTYSYDNVWSCVGSLENFLTSVTGTNWAVNFDYAKTGKVTYLTKATLLANTSPNQEIKHFNFDYLNVTNSDGLLLSNLVESSPDVSISKTHAFTYDSPGSLNYSNFYGIDHWGYDNGASTNTSLITNAPYNANRSSSLTNTQKGALTNITYPTGGSTQFIYELNEYGQLRESEYENAVLINKKPYGGLRVKTVIDKDISGAILVQKEYTYNSFANANKSSGVISSSIGLTSIAGGTFTSSQPNAPTFPTLANGTIYYSEGFHSIAETPIYYTNVTETLSDGAVTKSSFTSHNDYNDFFGTNFGRGNNQIGSPASYLLMRSLPKEVKYYKGSTLVKEIIYNYNLVDRHKARSLYTGGATASPLVQYTIDFLKTYYTYSGWLQKLSETERLYANATDYVETVTNYNYANTTYLQPSSVNTSSSKGEALLMSYKYPYDFSTEPYLTMVDKNIIVPIIEEISYLDNVQTAWKFTDYATFGTLQLPQKIRVKVGTGTEQTPITFNSYDTRGNLTKYTTRGGETANMEYYGTADLGKTDLLKTQTIGGGSTGIELARTISFDYLPLVGIISETDINNYTTTYQYDAFSRLKSIKDSKDYLLKDFNYHYANQAAITGLGITPTNTMNYVVSRFARDTQTGSALDNSETKTMTKIEYMDGLGRSLQSLVWKGVPNKTKDIILSTTTFDANGRANKSILPTSSDVVTGAYKSTAQTLAATFYANTYPYSELVYENSPLNRPFKQFGPGLAWRTLGSEKFVEMQYLTAGNNVIRFDVQANGDISGASNYSNNALYSNASISERGFYTYELKDKQGRVTHKIQQLDSAPTYATTAYCYNNLGQLAAVITPEAYKLFGTGTGQITSLAESDNIYQELVFGYHYDALGRLTEKQVPGAGWTRFVYDNNDRVVLKNDDQDGSNYWHFTKYDALSRPILAGLLSSIGTTARQTLQTAFDGITGQTYETRGGTQYNYSNASYPTNSIYSVADSDVKLVNYYDDHDWVSVVNPSVAKGTASFSLIPIVVGHKGLLTGTLGRNIETEEWYKTVKYYDYKGRNIITFSENHLGGINRSDYKYSFANELLRKQIDHQGILEIYDYTYDHMGRKTSFRHTKNGFSQNIAKYTYDDISRLSTKTYSPAGTTVGSAQTGLWTDNSSWQGGYLPTLKDVATINTGHELTVNAGQTVAAGQLVANGIIINNGTINLGNLTNNPAFVDLQNINYKYHIRGGLQGINLDGSGNLTNSIFSYKLGFEGDATYFDGNIRKQEWKSSLDNTIRSFTYSYDGASRITQGSFTGSGNEDYSLNSVTYNANGSIKTLSRNGYKANNSFGLVDNLDYTYNTNSNKILKVDDLSGETASLTDAAGDDYMYWPDGSLKSDANKGISLIEYNYLKLPKKIVIGSTTILNQYDASGRKLKETIGSNITDYSDNLVYKNNILYQLSHDEGRIISDVYEYNINDHLGNLRVSFKDSAGVAKITQSNAFGAWGENLKTLTYRNTTGQNPFKYTRKEELTETGYIDFGARLFDNVVPRFIGVDPLADHPQQLNLSPYMFSGNNPVRNIDPDGRRFLNFDSDGNYTGTTKDNWWHNFWNGSKGRIIDSDGTVQQKFKFSDPENDASDIQKGIIKKLEFVSEGSIIKMMAASGAFTHENKTANRSLSDRYDFIKQAGVGGGAMDFSYSAIPQMFQGASKDPLSIPSPMMFLVKGMAYNHLNFGNFLFGASGGGMGFTLHELLVGAHKNSRFPEDANGNRIPNNQPNPNGYKADWDSEDDQLSITKGWTHSFLNNYSKKEFKVKVGN